MSKDKYPSIFSRQLEAIVYTFTRPMRVIALFFFKYFPQHAQFSKMGNITKDIPRL